MTNRLHTIIPAVLQPTDPAQTAERPHADVTSAEKLSALGLGATQATISRDLEQLGAVKVRRDGRLAYAIPGTVPGSGTRLATVVRDWVRSVEPAGNLVVIKTPPGSAHLVGVVLDESELAEVVGTICGDDTIFVACRSATEAKALSGRLRDFLA